MLIYKDDYGNTATIDISDRYPYKGSPVKEPAFRLTVKADEDDYVYHVSVFPSIGDALHDLKQLSCGTFKEVIEG